MKTLVPVLLSAALSISAAFCFADEKPTPKPISKAERLFVERIKPLFIQKCGGCHGVNSKELKGDFDMRSRAGLLKGGESGEASLVPGDAKKSPLIAAIMWRDGLEMPPKENDRLTPDQIALVRTWIDAGAPWPNAARRKQIASMKWDNAQDGIRVSTSGGTTETWTNRSYKPENLWAYQPVMRPQVPKEHNHGPTNPIDAFINRKLGEAGVNPLGSADRRTLFRRLTYDLTGLPPTPADIDDFVADKSGDAVNNLVDRLLDSPHYGEQWGKHWLDVVRYADSAGFSNDFARPNAWRYRDYVIRSFNEDKPYDQFLREQIAGDEINPDDPECLIAVGFLRMGPWEHTSMSVAAVTRQQYLDDITNNVGVTFLGQELRCAKCHDHKFDPIPTRDYYSMQAIFAPVQFADRTVVYQNYENTDGFTEGEERIRRLQKAGGVKSLKSIPKEKWPVEEFDADTEKKGQSKVNGKRKQFLDRELKRYKTLAFSVYSGPERTLQSNRIMFEMPGNRSGPAPTVHILTGGSIESPGAVAAANVLSVVDAKDSSLKIPQSLVGRRAALADWLTDPKHPLTARVMVNRIWHYHFGRGLAGNPNNFGATGKKPTHPELLDFLADYFIRNNWSAKKLHRLIVTSETWKRASGRVPVKTKEVDPDNTLYSHFTPRRLSAEELRDSMLLVTGELNLRQGGIPARPEINLEVAMQPRHIMGSVGPAYQPSRTPEERNRRTVYAERIRTLRDPMLEVFNQPGLDTSCEQRDDSTTTPQSFTMLNSANSFDRALGLANRLDKISNKSPDKRINLAFRFAFGRDASPLEADRCRKHYDEMLLLHKDQKPQKVQPPKYVIREMVEEMTGLAFYWVEDLDVYHNYVPDLKPWDVSAEVRAMADVCLVLFNSNEFMYVY